MSWFQKQIMLPSKSKGTHLVTDHVVRELPEIKNYKVGLLHLFVCLLYTSDAADE